MNLSILHRLHQIREGQTYLLLHLLEEHVRQSAVDLRRYLEDEFAELFRFLEVNPAVLYIEDLVVLELLFDDGGEIHVVSLRTVTSRFADVGSEGHEFIVYLGVIPLDYGYLREGLAGDGFTLPVLPVLYLPVGLGELIGCVHKEGCYHHVLHRLGEVLFGKLRELLGYQLEGFPVVLRLPGRLDRRGQGVDEGVHVAEGNVVLFIPEGGGQNDVRVVGDRVHPDVEVDEEIELAHRRGVPPLDLLYKTLGWLLVPQNVVVGSEEVLEGYFLSPHTRSYEVTSPHYKNLQMILLRVRICYGEVVLTFLKLLDYPVDDLLIGFASGFHSFPVNVEGVFLVEGGVEGEPSQPYRQNVHIRGVVVSLELFRIHAPLGIEGHGVVAPLSCVEVPEGGGVLHPRGFCPVEGTSEVHEGCVESCVLGSDVVVEVPSTSSVATTQGKHDCEGSVVEGSAVVEVEQTRTCYHHGPALGLFRVLRKLPSHLNGEVSADSCLGFLPGGCIGLGIVVVLGVVASEASGDPRLSHEKIEGCGNEDLPPLPVLYNLCGDLPDDLLGGLTLTLCPSREYAEGLRKVCEHHGASLILSP